jgi:hypothetical protein
MGALKTRSCKAVFTSRVPQRTDAAAGNAPLASAKPDPDAANIGPGTYNSMEVAVGQVRTPDRMKDEPTIPPHARTPHQVAPILPRLPAASLPCALIGLAPSAPTHLSHTHFIPARPTHPSVGGRQRGSHGSSSRCAWAVRSPARRRRARCHGRLRPTSMWDENMAWEPNVRAWLAANLALAQPPTSHVAPILIASTSPPAPPSPPTPHHDHSRSSDLSSISGAAPGSRSQGWGRGERKPPHFHVPFRAYPGLLGEPRGRDVGLDRFYNIDSTGATPIALNGTLEVNMRRHPRHYAATFKSKQPARPIRDLDAGAGFLGPGRLISDPKGLHPAQGTLAAILCVYPIQRRHVRRSRRLVRGLPQRKAQHSRV